MIVVRFNVQSKPDKTEQLKAALNDVIAPSRQIEGCIEFDSVCSAPAVRGRPPRGADRLDRA